MDIGELTNTVITHVKENAGFYLPAATMAAYALIAVSRIKAEQFLPDMSNPRSLDAECREYD